MKNTGPRVLITGGGSGIGRACALQFAADGARVAVLDRNAASATEVAEACGGLALTADVSDPNAVNQAVAQIVAAYGGLDVLINNAGASHLELLHATEDAAFARMIAVNLTGVFNATRAAVPVMLADGGGAIVNIASGSAVRPTRGESAYAAAKAGVVALTQSTAQEYGPEIRANCLSPGVIRTPMSEGLFSVPELLAPVRKSAPAARAGTAEEVAEVAVFLASEKASYVTGQNLVVDGGLSLAQAGIDRVLSSLLEMLGKTRPESGSSTEGNDVS
ncbi:MAG: NAD(P)-dependent dehydrogenase (short-subunit alcohol dehydrogenase family) [Hyphomicrobiaceae bacterium]|jgi:NAD(P)-dependent dehydrogenase (short-subunit alcohol dehydrogenase family)